MPRRFSAWLNSPLPQAIFMVLVLVAKFTGYGRRIDNLRMWYGVGVTAVFAVMWGLAKRRGVDVPPWITAILFAYVAFEVLIPSFPIYYSLPYLNRFEHFTGFAVLTLFVLLFSSTITPKVFTQLGLLLIFALVWSVGLGNEIIEFFLYRSRSRVFFNRDTLIDLAMNTAAIALVLLIAPRFLRRAAPTNKSQKGAANVSRTMDRS